VRWKFPSPVSGSFQTSFYAKPYKDMKGQISSSPKNSEIEGFFCITAVFKPFQGRYLF